MAASTALFRAIEFGSPTAMRRRRIWLVEGVQKVEDELGESRIGEVVRSVACSDDLVILMVRGFERDLR